MTIGDKKITKSEFQYIWNKNNTESSLEKQSLDEYVDLFVNFKLKVAEAEAQGLDKNKSFVDELNGYRRQLVAPYLTDKETEDRLVKLTYDRMREYVEVSHILVQVSPFATPEDTLKAWNKINDVYKRVIADKADFAELATTYSDDVTKTQGGYIGFVTGIRFVYSFENGIYGTSTGAISQPFRTEYGYHIVKVHSRRPAYGRYKSAHIMIKVKESASSETQEVAKKAIYNVYDLLKKGGDFKKLAKQYSDDSSTSENGGDLGMIYCGSLPIEYEEAVFDLEKNTYSEPIKTKYGWHIIQVEEAESYPSLEMMREDINDIISKDERADEPRAVLVEKLKKEYGSSVDERMLHTINLAYDNLRLKKDSSAIKNLAMSNSRLFSIGKTTYSSKDFMAYLLAKPVLANNITKAFDGFVKDKVIAFEDAQLEKKYPEFGHLMQEYRDGLLLFEVSSKEVWDKASADEAGLKNYFEANKKSYTWEKPRFKGFLVECTSKEVAEKAKIRFGQLPADSIIPVLDREFNNESTMSLAIQRGLFEEGDNSVVDRQIFKVTPTVVESNFPESFLEGKLLKNGPEELSDVMGLVISDYQNLLEKKWLETLQKKYSVSINQAVLKSVNNN